MIEVLKLDHLGRGIGKINNKIIFIPNTLPGEIVEVKITNDKKNYCEGNVFKYLKVSDKRIESNCPYYGKCGGCNLRHLSYSEQLDYKQKKVEDIIHKYTNLDIKINNIIGSKNVDNYRNKVTFHCDNTLGLYECQSKKIINVDKCLLADEKINNILKESQKLELNTKEVIIKASTHETMIYYEGNIKGIEKLNVDTIINKDKIIKGKGYIAENLNNLKFIISPTSFIQVNTKQTIKLYDKVKEMANLSKKDNLLDLYCGTGTIGLYLSDKCNQVLGVEINSEAIKDANKNKLLNNIENATFIAGDAKEVIKRTNFKPDVIVVDPPRSGLFKGMVDDIIKFNAKKIIYVSCDPITLARDLKELNVKYNIKEIQPIDLFPNTHHVENVVLLEKNKKCCK